MEEVRAIVIKQLESYLGRSLGNSENIAVDKEFYDILWSYFHPVECSGVCCKPVKFPVRKEYRQIDKNISEVVLVIADEEKRIIVHCNPPKDTEKEL